MAGPIRLAAQPHLAGQRCCPALPLRQLWAGGPGLGSPRRRLQPNIASAARFTSTIHLAHCRQRRMGLGRPLPRHCSPRGSCVPALEGSLLGHCSRLRQLHSPCRARRCCLPPTVATDLIVVVHPLNYRVLCQVDISPAMEDEYRALIDNRP